MQLHNSWWNGTTIQAVLGQHIVGATASRNSSWLVHFVHGWFSWFSSRKLFPTKHCRKLLLNFDTVKPPARGEPQIHTDVIKFPNVSKKDTERYATRAGLWV